MEGVYYAAVVAFIAVLFAGPIVIPLLRRLKVRQVIRSQGPARHQVKAGTPTMGGVLFVTASLAAALAFAPERPPRLWYLAALVAWFAALGFIDDYLKVVRRRSLGLRARSKVAGQVAAGLAFYLAVTCDGLPTAITVPGLTPAWELGPWYAALVVLVLMGAANAVNLTDGLDGLAAGSSVVALSFYLLVALARGQLELAVFAAALAAALAAFLFYNAHPAQVIMGDVGSLAIGAALGGVAILTKTELLLPIVGGLFVLEALSVIMQVAYFRLTGGRRLLRMSPLHHHFELSGWSEQRVVTAFWALSVLFAALGLISLRGFGG